MHAPSPLPPAAGTPADAPLVVVLVADGVRPDTLAEALDAGTCPALARLRAEGGCATVTTVFPSVTGPAYVPFLLGRFPGDVGLPGIRWFDRARTRATWPDASRSYVGMEMRHIDRDLDAAAPTLYERVLAAGGRGLAALEMIGRGLPRRDQFTRHPRFLWRAWRTHLDGDPAAWVAIDREIGAQAADRIAAMMREPAVRGPRVAYVVCTGIDKMSHAAGHACDGVRDALAAVDATAARLRADAEAGGWWARTTLLVVSDHGHSPVTRHDDLADWFTARGHVTGAHPFAWKPRREVAVMVSGNAMAHVYLDVRHRARPWWPALAARWEPTAAALLARESVDLLLLPHAADACEVRHAERGAAMVRRVTGDARRGAADPCARYAYQPIAGGDPLGLGATPLAVDAADAHDACAATDYPDALVQIAHVAGSARAGDLLVSAARAWDFRARYEPVPHVSTHGALYREHMEVPLLSSRPFARAPRRTADVMPSALRALGLEVPEGLDGASFF